MSTPIKREDIRKGDRVRLIATTEFTAICDLGIISEPDSGDTETYELIERPVVLPTVPGTVIRSDNRSSDNDPGWVFERGNRKWYGTDGETYTPEEAAALMDGKGYQMLRPVAEVAAEVLAEVHALFKPGAFVLAEIDALAAKWATK